MVQPTPTCPSLLTARKSIQSIQVNADAKVLIKKLTDSPRLTDANVLIKKLQAAPGLKFGNSLYNVEFLPENASDDPAQVRPSPPTLHGTTIPTPHLTLRLHPHPTSHSAPPCTLQPRTYRRYPLSRGHTAVALHPAPETPGPRPLALVSTKDACALIAPHMRPAPRTPHTAHSTQHTCSTRQRCLRAHRSSVCAVCVFVYAVCMRARVCVCVCACVCANTVRQDPVKPAPLRGSIPLLPQGD